MLLPLLSPAGVPVAQQPLVQEHGVDRADVGLRQQLPAHIQQPLCGIPLLQGQRSKKSVAQAVPCTCRGGRETMDVLMIQ